MFLGTGTMVVCLKHVGITDSDRERLKMSVRTPAIWSAHARSTHPGNLSGPVDLFKGLTHTGCGERDQLEQLMLSCMFQCYLPGSQHITTTLHSHLHTSLLSSKNTLDT